MKLFYCLTSRWTRLGGGNSIVACGLEEVPGHLLVQPILGGRVEGLCQPGRYLGCDFSVAGDHLLDLSQRPLDELHQIRRLPAALFEMLTNVETGVRSL